MRSSSLFSFGWRAGLLCLGGLGGLLVAVRSQPVPAPPPNLLVLTPEQTRWLTQHPVIRIACDPDWPPFSFGGAQGRLTGLDVDLTALVERRAGLSFQHVAPGDWSTVLAKAKAREIDVLSGVAPTPSRGRDFIFTTSYLNQSFGIITRADEPFLATLSQLGGRRIAVVPDHAVTEKLRHDQPGARFVPAANTDQALRLVSSGEADVALTDLVNASYIIKTRGLMNLKIAGIADYRFELHFAVRRDWPELAAILDAVIASLDDAEKQAIVDRWVRVDYADVVRWDKVWRALVIATGVVLLVVAAFYWHNHRLRRELTERRRVEAELRAARDRLEELNGEKTRLLDMAAHDLRNPLTGVMLSLEAVDTDDRAERRRVLGEVAVLTRHMVQLIGDLLDVQMLENGSRVYHLEPVDAGAVVDEMVRENRFAAARKRILVNIAPPVRPCRMRADARALRQVVDNLLSNALKYSPIGGTVWIGLQPGEPLVRLLVRDEGPGISPADVPRLFTKYGCLGARPTAGETSVGLGLSIVHQLVEGMGGRIRCETELGRGATFIVELPEAPASYGGKDRLAVSRQA
ncbi:MAG: transporter substrate-binding domain-containing protein [Opitutae bacterium]|nr:transporter substrate-binding domain-containing protein [Opitutae bacterium]